MAKSQEQSDHAHTPRVSNRKARHEYFITETLECGVELVGTEVKSLRAGGAKIDEAYVRIKNGQLFLVGSHFSPYQQASAAMQHDPTRDRKLLIHRRQMAQLETHVKQKGQTLVPLAIYFKRGWAKCEIGLAVGKQKQDKRQDIKKREAQRDISREMRRRNR